MSGSDKYELKAVLLFSKLNDFFFGYFDPENIFLIIEINNFRGDLTDISAKKEGLLERVSIIEIFMYQESGHFFLSFIQIVLGLHATLHEPYSCGS